MASSGDDKYLDEFDKYNIEQGKYENHAHSGKGRSKKEAEQHHHEDPSGHTRKDVQKLVNNAHKQADENKKKANWLHGASEKHLCSFVQRRWLFVDIRWDIMD